MKVVAAVDPGLSTGLAVFRGETLVELLTVDEGGLESTLRRYDPDEVVLEKPPAKRHQESTTDGPIVIVEHQARAIYHIKPSQWKNSPLARLLDSDALRAATQHEKDAAGIGRWFLAMRRLNAITEDSLTPGAHQ